MNRPIAMHWLGERDPSLRAAESIRKLVFSYWSACSWQRGLKLHSSGLQVHRNIWTSSGVTETPCSSRTEQTGWFARVYRQHQEVGGTCPWKAVSLRTDSELSLQISQHRSKGIWPPLFAKGHNFLCWLLMYPVHMLTSNSSTYTFSLF